MTRNSLLVLLGRSCELILLLSVDDLLPWLLHIGRPFDNDASVGSDQFLTSTCVV